MHEVTNDNTLEYGLGDMYTNSAESIWSTLKRAHKKIYHKMSPKHLDHYTQKFVGKRNLHDEDTFIQMGILVRDLDGERLPHADLKQPNYLSSGARS